MFSIISAASWRPPSAACMEFAVSGEAADQNREKDYAFKDYMVSSTSKNDNIDSFNTRANEHIDNNDGETSGNNKRSEQGVEAIEFVTNNQYDIDTLGLRLSGNRSVGVFVTSILAGSTAEQSRKISPGDHLLNIDNIALAGLTPSQVVRVLRSILAAKSRVTITVAHPWADRMCTQPSTSRRFPTMPQVVKTSVVIHQPSNAKNGAIREEEIQYEPTPHTVNTGAAANCTIVPVASRGPSSTSSVGKHDAESHRIRSSKTKVAPFSIKYPSKEAISSDGSMLPSPDSTDHPTAKLSPSTIRANQTLSSSRRLSMSARSVSADSSPATSSTVIGVDGEAIGGSSSIGSCTPDVGLDERRSSFTVMTRAASAKSDENSLNVPMNSRIGLFMNAVGRRKSLTKNFSNDELPLVSFDQLTQSSSSSSSGKYERHDRNDSSHSKSSKGSTRSNKSQELSWHCPVCLDGASRVDRTQRKMMSTVCGHVFCSKCVEDVIYKYKMCPTCRMSLSVTGEVHPIFMI